MVVDTLVVGVLQANCYIVGSSTTNQALVVDPGDGAATITAALKRHGLHLTHIVATHAHFDHLLAARELQEATGAAFYLHPDDLPALAQMRQMAIAWIGAPADPPRVDKMLSDGAIISMGEVELEVRATPGHSPGGVTLVDHRGRRAFTGDTLFAGSIGRCDLPHGNLDALLASIRSQILTLPDDYAILPGHGPASTVGEERLTNPFLSAALGGPR